MRAGKDNVRTEIKGKLTVIQWFKNTRMSRYRIRILIAFFAVAVLAIGFIDVAVFRGLFVGIREESDKETREVLMNINESYENQLEQYQSQAQLLFRNYSIKAFLITKGREESHIDSIYESMRAVAGNMTGISSIILFNKEEVLASFDTGTVTSMVKEEIVKKVNQTTTDKEIFFVYPDARNYQRQMVLFWTDREFLYGPSSCGVALVINIDVVQERVLPWNREIENPIYIFYQDGEIVANQKSVYKDDIQKISKDIISQNIQEDSYYETIEGEKKAVSYIRSKDGRFFSIRVQEFASSRDQVNQALRTILVSTVFVMIVITVLVWLLAGWIYRPLGKIFHRIFEISQSEMETARGKDELMMATDALQDVNQNMNLLKSQIRSNAVVRFLRQGTIGDGFTNKMFEFGSCHPNHFIVVVFRYSIEEWSQNEALVTYLSEAVLIEKDGGQHCYWTGQGEIVIILYEETEQHVVTEQIRRTMEQVLSELYDYYNVRGCMGISQCTSVEKLPKAYRKAALLTEYYILSKNILIMDEEMLSKKQQGAIIEPERENILQLVKGIGGGEILLQVSSLLQNLTSYHIEVAQKYLKQLIADVIRLSETVGGEKNEQYEIYLEDFLTNQIFMGQVNIDEWLIQLFLQVQKQLKEGKQFTTSRIMEDIVEHINQNYKDCSLSVESMANKYGWSVSYFSKLFNNYTGMAFPYYVNQLRLQTAREILLKESHSTVQEIAMRVGFNSSSYFAAAFRKYYGISPSLMRKIKGN